MPAIYTGIDTTTQKELFKKNLEMLFDTTDREAVVESDKLYIQKPGTDLYERIMRIAGLPRGYEIEEGQEVPQYRPKIGGTKDITQKVFGLGFRFSWLFKKTEKWDLASQWAKNLSLNQKELKDVELAKLWNSPTSTYTGFDSQVLGYANHTCLDDAASTYDNIISAALSTTSLESAKYYFETLKDDQGASFFAKPDLLYHHPALEFTAWEIFKSSGKAHELSNTANYWQNKWEPFMYHRLTSSTAWGLIARNHPKYNVLCYTLAEADKDVRDAPDNTRDTVMDSIQAFTWGFGDGRMVCIGNT